MLIARPYLWLIMFVLGLGLTQILPTATTEALDTLFLDALADLRRDQVARSAGSRSSALLIVADGPALDRLGERWPPGPSLLARVVQRLTLAKVAAIGLEGRLARPDPRDLEGHGRLVAAIKASGKVVLRDELATPTSETGPVLEWHATLQEAAAGHGATRNGPAFGRSLRRVSLVAPSYALELIRVYQPNSSVRVSEDLLLVGAAFGSSLMVSLTPVSSLLFASQTLVSPEKVSLADVLDGKVDDTRMAGRIAMVGVTAGDVALGVLEGSFVRPQIELDAGLLDNLLAAHVVSASDRSTRVVSELVVLGALGLVCAFAPIWVGLCAIPVSLLAVMLLAGLLYVHTGQRYDLTAVLAGVAAAGFVAILARWLERAALAGRFVGVFGGHQVIGQRLFGDGMDLLNRGDIPAALGVFQQAMKADTSMALSCTYQIVMGYLKLRELEEAEKFFVSLPPDRLSIVEAYELGLRLSEVGYYDEARAMFAAVQARDESYRDVKAQLERANEALSSRSDVIERLVIKDLRKDYERLELMRRGGMAIIYQGLSRVQSKIVAIKILLPHLNTDKNIVARFFIEAETLKEFDHPNIIKVLEIEREGALQYYVMEHVHPAISLHDLIDKEGKLPTDRAIRLVKQICRGLEYSHRKGVIHRDIKPHNILVTGDDVIKLIDFGIARVEHHGTMTMTGVVMGTPRYMAPEQIRGERVDERCDIYSVGVTFFEMISGIRGQQNPTVERISGGTSIQQLLLRQALPSPLVAILLRCLENDKTRRYSSPMEMISDLEAYETRPAGWEDL